MAGVRGMGWYGYGYGSLSSNLQPPDPCLVNAALVAILAPVAGVSNGNSDNLSCAADTHRSYDRDCDKAVFAASDADPVQPTCVVNWDDGFPTDAQLTDTVILSLEASDETSFSTVLLPRSPPSYVIPTLSPPSP